MKVSYTIAIILGSLILFPSPLAAQQNVEKPQNKLINAEPKHKYFNLDSARTIVFIMERMDIEKSQYLHEFQTQSNWAGSQVFVRLDEALGPFKFKINGFLLGSGEGTGLPLEFNVTPFLQTDANTIELEIEQEASPGSKNKDVTGSFLVREPVHVRDLELSQYPQAGSEHILIRVHLYVQSFLTGKEQDRKMILDISDPNGNSIYSEERKLDFPLAFRQEMEFTFDHILENPKTWSPVHPDLYSLQISLIDLGNKNEEIVSRHFGIRSAVFQDSIMIFNGDTIIPKKSSVQTD